MGLGAAALAEPQVSDGDAVACVREAWSCGIRYFDTAPMYGCGRSERLLGRALEGLPRDEYLISTKVGRLVRPGHPDTKKTGADWVFDFSRDAVLTSFEESLARLKLDSVDIVYVHDPDDYWQQALDEALPTLAQLAAEKVIRFVGVGMTQAPMLARFIREADIDIVLEAGVYTLLDAQALDALLPEATSRGVSVVAAQAMHGGLIDGVPNPLFRYRPVDDEIRGTVSRISRVCRDFGVPTAAAAISFPYGHPAVRAVLTGPANVSQLRQNIAWASTNIPPDLWQRLADEGIIPVGAPTPSGPMLPPRQ